MIIPEERIQNLIRSTTFTEIDAQIPDRYAIVVAQPGGAYHVSFNSPNRREEYLFLTRSKVNLFCNNGYYGGLLIVYDYGKLEKVLVFCIRANTFVLANNCSAPYITPIAQNADFVWDFELENPEYLRKHFEKVYMSLLESNPEEWWNNFHQLLRTNTTFSVYENFIDF